MPGFKIHGNVHGGAYPIQGATVRLMETQSNGSWDAGADAYVGTAKQLLVTSSDGNGNFSFPDSGWTCDAGQYAYITVTGGHTAQTNNNNVVQVGVIGSCATELATTAEIDAANVYISELSTVAAAYALNNFISIDNTNQSTGQQIVNITAPTANNAVSPACKGTGSNMVCTHGGLGNAFQNAYNLVDQVTYVKNRFPTGTARTSIPGNSQSVVPQALIDTLGNILQSCVDSGGGSVSTFGSYTPGGSGSSSCGDLFYYTTPPGSNTAPTNTLQAAINMAQNPNNNVDNLFKLQPRAVFFTPYLTADTLSGTSRYISYSLSIFYTGTGIGSGDSLPYPVDVALDDEDNAYVLYGGDNSGASYGAVDEFGPGGQGIFAGAHQTTIGNPMSIALDSNGVAYVTNDSATNGDLFQINTPSSGGTLGNVGHTRTVNGGYAAGLAIDMSNLVWVSRDAGTGQSLYQYDPGNNYALTRFDKKPRFALASKKILVDYNQNVVGASSDTDNLGATTSTANASLVAFWYGSFGNTTTTPVSTTQLKAKNGNSVVANNADDIYFPLYQQVDSATGSADAQGNVTVNVNGAGTYTAASTTGVTYTSPQGAAIDGSGNLFWTDNTASGQLFRLVPSAAPSINDPGTLISVFPCYPLNGQCYGQASTNLRGGAIDSSGAIWYLSDSAAGVVIQTFGLAAPSYPLLSYARGGVIIE